MTVHLAGDEAEARDIVAGVLTSRGVKVAVKAKSMLSEEIHLNPALEAKGIEVVETDLGEYVVQLMGDRPSHLVAPIIHRTRGRGARAVRGPLRPRARRRPHGAHGLRPRGAARALPGRRRGHHRRQLRRGRDRHPRGADERGQRAPVDLRAPHPGGADGHRAARAALRGPRGARAAAGRRRHGPDGDDVRQPHGGPAPPGRARRARGDAPRARGQRARRARGLRLRGRAALHPLRRLPERLPGVPPGRRATPTAGSTAGPSAPC